MRTKEQRMVGEEGGIVLTDGISRVILAPAGPPALGFPTRIEVATGPFSAVIEAEAWDYKKLRRAGPTARDPHWGSRTG